MCRINKIAVTGTGYVGLSLATLLVQHNKVVAVDVFQELADVSDKVYTRDLMGRD